MRTSKVCDGCGATFHKTNKDESFHKRKYCTYECYNSKRTQQVTKTCPNCGEQSVKRPGLSMKRFLARKYCDKCSRGCGQRNGIPTEMLKPIILQEIEAHGQEAVSFWTGVPLRRLFGIIHDETHITTFDVADRIVTGLGRPELWHTELAEAYAKVEL